MKITKRKIRDKFNEATTFAIRNINPPLPWNKTCGYLTIFHDYEGDYALSGKRDSSYYGVTQLLDIEKNII